MTLVCPQCMAEFRVKPSQAKRRKYCSKPCMAARSHGMSYTRTYRIWSEMIRRCTKLDRVTATTYYGMLIHPPWLKFEGFYADMGECPDGLTIERIDNGKGYSPDNCKWATVTEQNRNRSCVRFSMEDAEEMRSLRRQGSLLREIARRYDTSEGHVSRIVSGKVWI